MLMSHRDHYSHSVYVFLIGLAMYDAIPIVRKEYNKYYGFDENDKEKAAHHFIKFWGLASLFHDIGYPFEISFEQVSSYFSERKKESGSDAPLVILSTASPYKFPSAVLAALGGAAEGDEFAETDALAALTGLPVPPSLASLRGKAERHRDVIGVGEIIPYIQQKLSEDKLT